MSLWLRCALVRCASLQLLGACAVTSDDSPSSPSPAHAQVVRGRDLTDLDDVEVAADGRPVLCARDRADAVRDVFCADTPPQVASLSALQELLGLVPGGLDNHNAELYGANAFVTLLGHSTSSALWRVSPLNPRMIVLGDSTIMAFERGAQKVEVIARARGAQTLHFYLFRFEQACNRTTTGCSRGDLYTPRVEQDWLRVTVQDDEDLKNTAQDCRSCHQRATDQPHLLMRELETPWTHFFMPQPSASDAAIGPGVQGHDLRQDYLDAKGDEAYGGFHVDNLMAIAPFVLQSSVPLDQPVLFDSPGIENERFPYDPQTGYPTQPRLSPTWEEAYEAFKAGDQLPLPYVEPRVSDPAKQAEYVEAYSRYRRGALRADELPDLSESFPDDPETRARIGLQTAPDATAEDALIQACGSCHNDVLDQTLTRARFNINLWALDSAAIARAIERVERAPDQPGVMPPPEARQLDAQARQKLLDFLRDDPLQLRPSLKLTRAARLGMAGGKDRRSPLRR